MLINHAKAAAESVLLLAGAPVKANEAKDCLLLDVPVSVSAINTNYDTLRVDSNIDAVEWTLSLEYSLLY